VPYKSHILLQFTFVLASDDVCWLMCWRKSSAVVIRSSRRRAVPTVAYGANSILRHASIAVDVHVSAEKGRHLLVSRINSILMLAICHIHSSVHCQTTLCLKTPSRFCSLTAQINHSHVRFATNY